MKSHAWNFFSWLVTVWQNLDFADFAKVRPINNFFENHDFSCMWVHLFDTFEWKKIWPKFGQVWPNFDQILGSNFLSFHHKMGFGKMHWFPKYEIFLSNGSKVIALGALEPPKADFSITLRPLKLQISEKVLRPMKFRSKALVLTYPKPFGMKVGGSQVFWTDNKRLPPFQKKWAPSGTQEFEFSRLFCYCIMICDFLRSKYIRAY